MKRVNLHKTLIKISIGKYKWTKVGSEGVKYTMLTPNNQIVLLKTDAGDCWPIFKWLHQFVNVLFSHLHPHPRSLEIQNLRRRRSGHGRNLGLGRKCGGSVIKIDGLEEELAIFSIVTDS